MRKKYIMSSMRWSDKNRIYLERLGFLDGRSGRKASTKVNLSDFINECVTLVCESSMHSRASAANSDELRDAYVKFNIALQTRIIKKANEEIERLKPLRTTVSPYQ